MLMKSGKRSLGGKRASDRIHEIVHIVRKSCSGSENVVVWEALAIIPRFFPRER